MQLKADEIARIRATMEELKEHREPAGTSFYENLFRISPELRPMFREDMTGQGMKFLSTLAVIVDTIGDEARLDPKLDELGRDHAALGVRAEHYAPMREALMATMKQYLGGDFTPEVEAAWERAYGQIAGRMLAAGGG